jgi:DNA-binding beta-propeller fold protein YncE
MKRKIFFLLFLLILAFSCKSVKDKKVPVTKDDKTILEEKKQDIQETKKYFNVEINLTEGVSQVTIGTEIKGLTPLKMKLEEGGYDMILSREGYPDQLCRLEIRSDGKYLFRHNKRKNPLKQIGVFECGNQPKQVIFSPDDRYIFIPLLEEDGFQVFSMRDLKVEQFVKPPDSKHRTGYAEGLFVSGNSFCISQMSGFIYEYSYPDLKYQRTIETGGMWSKFMTYSDIYHYLAVSNWLTNNVSIIDYTKGKLLKLLPAPASPRGLAFSNDSKYFFMTSFDGGKIVKYDTGKWIEIKSIFVNEAAMRHIVLTKDNTEAFVSNMYHAVIYEIALDKFEIVSRYRVDYNPNTIDLTPDNKYLFVSSRGPNNPVSYLQRSPRNGTITVIDVKNKKELFSFEGGNQPTGLDVSNNGKYLCFSNFLDKNIEIYWIGDLQ